MGMRIRTGDEVIVVSGKDRGKSGRVLRVDRGNERVFVEGLNIIKRHVRPSQFPGASAEEAAGGVIESEGPIHVSNVMLVDPKDNKPTRIGVSREGGVRKRVARRSGTAID